MATHSPTIRFSSSHRAAREIAQTYRQEPQRIHVSMKGKKDVASLLTRVAEAKIRAHAHPRALD